MTKIKLFCFPYAGGSAVIFNRWKQYLIEQIELIPVELAGRGKRISEPLYPDISSVIEDVYKIVRKSINDSPYAIFGHSMGGMISYHLCQKLREERHPSPIHVFFSGRGAPHISRPDRKKFHLLHGEEFKKEVINLGGTPPEFFDHPELLETFLPSLKNDFRLAESDIIINEINPLDTNISILLGKDEDLTSEQCAGWKKHSKNMCSIHFFEGGHFFLHKEEEQIVSLINHTLIDNIFV